jgi:glycosyltransferase involved in cell wall biosynthesis
MLDINPKVSIIIPVYNGSNYLKDAIDSALIQTYNNLEIIVVNDGSTDEGETERIALSYSDRITYISKENGGVATALNAGIKMMTGDYFSWLSHDDMYYPDKIEKQVNFIRKNTEAKVLFCNTEIISANGSIIKSVNVKGVGKLRGGICFFETWIYACSLLVHKSCFDVIGLFNEDNRTTQDVEFTLLLLFHFNVWHLQEILTKRRDHNESGFYRQRELNIKERELFLKSLLDRYGISFFIPELSEKSQDIDIAKAYHRLGDRTVHSRKISNGIIFSRYCYYKSFKLWPSLFNYSLYKLIVGSFLTRSYLFCINKIKMFVLHRFSQSSNRH